jgi:DNA-binding response OmpR family regulator
MAHILLVDDDKDQCELLSYILLMEGHTVTTAKNGNEAIKRFHRQVPDIILLDLIMPEADGIEVCWRLRAFSNIPIVIMSGSDRELNILRAFEAGVNAYVTKPFTISELFCCIETLLSRHSLDISKYSNPKNLRITNQISSQPLTPEDIT